MDRGPFITFLLYFSYTPGKLPYDPTLHAVYMDYRSQIEFVYASYWGTIFFLHTSLRFDFLDPHRLGL